MLESEEIRVESATSADLERIQKLVHDPSARVVRALLQNRNLVEDDVLIIANRTNLTPDILEVIAKDRRWSESYPVRLALVRNPRSPLSVSLSVARFLRIFDLEEITRNHYIPVILRSKVESMIMERVPTMALGNKKTLAKKAAGNLLLKLLQDRLPEVVALCLNNPRMVEAHLYKLIGRRDTAPETIAMIARHPLWCGRPMVRFALVRNPHTPLSLSAQFLGRMKLVDLRELSQDPSLPITVKPFVHRELVERGSDPSLPGEERVYEIREEEVEELEAALDLQKELASEEEKKDNCSDCGRDEEKNENL
jgi:hypothetical protein